MGRNPCCAKEGLNRGAWTVLEDQILTDFIKSHGEGRWRNLPKKAGLKRCGKSCRLRWLNYLRPDIKRGNISADEEELIVRLHKLLGNRWSLIAGRLPGRTANEIKNYWNTNLCKKVHQDIINTSPQNLPEATQLTVDAVKLGSSSVSVAVAEESNNCDANVDNLCSAADFMMDFNAGEMSFLSELLNSDQPHVLLDDLTMQRHDWTLNTYGQ